MHQKKYNIDSFIKLAFPVGPTSEGTDETYVAPLLEPMITKEDEEKGTATRQTTRDPILPSQKELAGSGDYSRDDTKSKEKYMTEGESSHKTTYSPTYNEKGTFNEPGTLDGTPPFTERYNKVRIVKGPSIFINKLGKILKTDNDKALIQLDEPIQLNSLQTKLGQKSQINIVNHYKQHYANWIQNDTICLYETDKINIVDIFYGNVKTAQYDLQFKKEAKVCTTDNTIGIVRSFFTIDPNIPYDVDCNGQTKPYFEHELKLANTTTINDVPFEPRQAPDSSEQYAIETGGDQLKEYDYKLEREKRKKRDEAKNV